MNWAIEQVKQKKSIWSLLSATYYITNKQFQLNPCSLHYTCCWSQIIITASDGRDEVENVCLTVKFFPIGTEWCVTKYQKYLRIKTVFQLKKIDHV